LSSQGGGGFHVRMTTRKSLSAFLSKKNRPTTPEPEGGEKHRCMAILSKEEAPPGEGETREAPREGEKKRIMLKKYACAKRSMSGFFVRERKGKKVTVLKDALGCRTMKQSGCPTFFRMRKRERRSGVGAGMKESTGESVCFVSEGVHVAKHFSLKRGGATSFLLAGGGGRKKNLGLSSHGKAYGGGRALRGEGDFFLERTFQRSP